MTVTVDCNCVFLIACIGTEKLIVYYRSKTDNFCGPN